ncbi:hypothetical protein ABZ946_10220 [Streptomyces sp. NPDC046324]|uniref:hypothetical protein n=1 Tax=Streptomyces sp. NPDC046324 TaxID=3154915 RepID=UPI0033E51C0A
MLGVVLLEGPGGAAVGGHAGEEQKVGVEGSGGDQGQAGGAEGGWAGFLQSAGQAEGDAASLGGRFEAGEAVLQEVG